MTFTIPRPKWVSDRLIEEHGANAGFQMYTTEGNDAVAQMVQNVIDNAEVDRLLPDSIVTRLKEGVVKVSKRHPEIHDTEPEWAITDAVNAYFDTVGFARVDRDDLF